jgi:hypothetical protein
MGKPKDFREKMVNVAGVDFYRIGPVSGGPGLARLTALSRSN